MEHEGNIGTNHSWGFWNSQEETEKETREREILGRSESVQTIPLSVRIVRILEG